MAAGSADWRTYLEHAFHDLAHPVALVGLVVLVVLVPSSWDALTVIACTVVSMITDGLVLVVISRMPGYRRWVDRQVAESARQDAAARRNALLAAMSDEHRLRLQELETLLDAMRTSTVARVAPAQRLIDTCGELLVSFVRLAIEHRCAQVCLTSGDPAKLGEEAAALERAKASGTDHVRGMVERRLALARERSELREIGRARVAAIEEQLAMISERIHLAHEDLRAPPAPRTEAVAARVASVTNAAEQALDEVDVEDMRVEEEVDARMLALGRPPR